MTEFASPSPDKPRSPWRWALLWPWFVAGFLLTFVLVALFTSAYYYNGHALYRMSVGEYYVLEIKRAWNPRALGPASGSEANAMQTALQHILISVAGGGVLLGVAWIARKLRRK